MTKLTVGVAGHRRIHDELRVASAAQSIACGLRERSRTWVVVSPLAEGADRLLAKALTRAGHSELNALLPMPREDYEEDFQSQGSKAEFHALLSKAASVQVAGPKSTRPQVYQDLIPMLVEKCDAFVVVWDGQPARGPGGTALLVEAIRAASKPLAWIHDPADDDSPGLTLEPEDFWQ